MPIVGGKGKSKARDSRRSRSRNTTPSSVGASTSTVSASHTAYLEMPLSQLMVPTNLTYDDLLDRHGSTTGIPESKHLDALAADLRTLAQLADIRSDVCNKGMRQLSLRRKNRLEDEREKERESRDQEERKEKLKRDAAARNEEEERRGSKASKIKKRKDRSKVRDERPLVHGAHGLARQDGGDVEMQDASSSPERRRSANPAAGSPDEVKRETASVTSSSLSPSSHHSPNTGPAVDAISDASSPASSSSLSDHQPVPAPAVPHYQTFGPDPSTFDDPTRYDIREVQPGMTEEEIKDLYSVAMYPHDDLRHLIPGTPPDRDFSNAKPTNQVAATTFAAYIEPYFRPFTEEDVAFLRERGDRSQPFVIPRRGKRHYTEIWAEEDGAMAIDSHASSHKSSANQARGNIDLLNDDTAETEQISSGPLLSRLLAAMRVEHRPSPDDKPLTNGVSNGDGPKHAPNGEGPTEGDAAAAAAAGAGGEGEKTAPLPSATFIPDSTQPGWKVPATKLEYSQVDERLKQELRYLGFLSEDAEPDYDAHYDDEIAARLRLLQNELKEQSIANGAHKARIAELAKVRLAHQEYNTILEDLDNQVQQAYLKRTRTLGKGKKQQKRPGGAGGGSHYVGGPVGAGVSRPGIGDVARTLMEKRKKWIDCIGPVFDEGLGRVPNDTVFEPEVMVALLDRERDGWDEGEE
ncbi:MAG: Transcriptional regulator [Thelocarpon superellum]|nr:MAG: Transcriptional regulator [Thelocarpon superellum]